MSFRELRSFTEKMRSLGYQNLISMDSFRSPNFNLVADVLAWLVKSYDPSFDVLDDISSEQDRVIFIKSIALFLAQKAGIKLNTRKLYMADGYAVKELLKLTNILYSASKQKDHEDEDAVRSPTLDLTGKLLQLKACRTLASEITEQGSQLYDSLARETELHDLRQEVISRPFELRAIEQGVSQAVEGLREQISSTRGGLENLAADETNLMAKIEKKKTELQRADKRLKSLQGVRPAYMDEYERIEVDLVKLYNTYMEKFRNLSYLEQQLDEYNRQEQDKFEETEMTLRRMQTRLREEELSLLRGDREIRETVKGGGLFSSASNRPKRPHAAGRRKRDGRGPADSDSDAIDYGGSDNISLGSGLSDDSDEIMGGRPAGQRKNSQSVSPARRDGAANGDSNGPSRSQRRDDLDSQRTGGLSGAARSLGDAGDGPDEFGDDEIVVDGEDGDGREGHGQRGHTRPGEGRGGERGMRRSGRRSVGRGGDEQDGDLAHEDEEDGEIGDEDDEDLEDDEDDQEGDDGEGEDDNGGDDNDF